jgi:hypothetical protein
LQGLSCVALGAVLGRNPFCAIGTGDGYLLNFSAAEVPEGWEDEYLWGRRAVSRALELCNWV